MNFRARIKQLRRAAPRPSTILTDLEVEEVSLVDKPANNRPWSVIKTATLTEDTDGVLVAEPGPNTGTSSQICEGLWRVLSVLEPAAKSLAVNDTAREKFFAVLGDVKDRIWSVTDLLEASAGTPFRGSLDPAIGGELATVAEAFLRLAEAFGVTEAPPEQEPVAMSASGTPDVQKAGRAMSETRMRDLGSAIHAARELAELLAELFSTVGGNDEILDACREKSEKSASDIVSRIAAHVDSRMGALVDALSASHDSIASRIDSNTDVMVKADQTTVTKAVSRTVPESRQLPDTGSRAESDTAPSSMTEFIARNF